MQRIEPTKEQVDKLPVWAQNLIWYLEADRKRLERDNERLKDEIDSMKEREDSYN
jgi:hypothetical protein